MASEKVQVDSLFLGEGFGTLDESTLDTALETLSSLQQEGKLIGVISHVTSLKERISTRIQVTPGTGGTAAFLAQAVLQEVQQHETHLPTGRCLNWRWHFC